MSNASPLNWSLLRGSHEMSTDSFSPSCPISDRYFSARCRTRSTRTAGARVQAPTGRTEPCGSWWSPLHRCRPRFRHHHWCPVTTTVHLTEQRIRDIDVHATSNHTGDEKRTDITGQHRATRTPMSNVRPMLPPRSSATATGPGCGGTSACMITKAPLLAVRTTRATHRSVAHQS